MASTKLDKLLQEYCALTGEPYGHYQTVPAGTPMAPETQVPGYGGESPEPFNRILADGTEFRTIPGGLDLDYAYGAVAIYRIAENGRTWVSEVMARRSYKAAGRWLRERIAEVEAQNNV